jgi:hypothetical protein
VDKEEEGAQTNNNGKFSPHQKFKDNQSSNSQRKGK